MLSVPLLPARERQRLWLFSARPEQRRRRSRAFDRARVFGYFYYYCSRFGGLSLSLSLSLSFVSFFFFRDTLFFFRRENAFFDTTRREVPFPRALERCHQGGGSSFREREREMRLCLCLSPFLCRVFASFLNKKKYFLLSVSIIHRPGVLVGATFMSRQILHSPGFYASREERQRGIDEPVQEKRVRGQKWYKHRVRRYFEERNKTKAPGELLPWLNAMFAPIHQPYDDVVGRKRT